MKKLRWIALIAVCALLLGGCQPIASLLSRLSADTYDPHKYLSAFSENWEYSHLSSKEQLCYGSLYTAVTDSVVTNTYVTYTDESGTNQQKDGIRVSFSESNLTNDSIIRIYEAFFTDNPQFFFLDRTYSMEGLQPVSGITYYNAIILQYTLPTEQRVQATSALDARVQSILSECPTVTDNYVTEQYLHDQLTSSCTYDMEAATEESISSPNAYTAYGALIEGKAVCEGYAKAMQLLLQKVSIPCTLVTGTAKENNESHMWNLVQINGETYHLDPTWNDSNDQRQYTFFNLTTEMVEDSCTIDNSENLPSCTATKDNTFVRNNTIVDTYERQVIAQKIAARIQLGETTIQLRFADGKYENGILFLKNKKLMSTMVNKHLSDSNLSMWEYDLWADSSQQVLTLIQK